MTPSGKGKQGPKGKGKPNGKTLGKGNGTNAVDTQQEPAGEVGAFDARPLAPGAQAPAGTRERTLSTRWPPRTDLEHPLAHGNGP